MYIHHPITVGIVAGEISGDILGAELIKTLKKYLLNVNFFGIAGPNMQSEGMETWYNIEELSTMGIMEVIVYLPRILKIRKKLIQRFSELKPDIFIGIDSPDFNISLENNLKKIGIYTIHYVSPSIWAWRKNRIFKIAHSINKILVLLPFEKKIYDRFNIPCEFIGHPLADTVPLYPNKTDARRILGINNKTTCLALLPGSRNNEVKRLINHFLTCAKLLNYHIPGIEIIVSIAHTKLNQYFKDIYSTKIIKFHILKNQSLLAMIAADAALLASGTATLECMLAKCPMVVAYRMHPITFVVVKHLVKTQWISLPNLLAKRTLVKEFIQKNCQANHLAQALLPLLTNINKRLILQNNFLKLHKKIKCNANEQAARVILKSINHILNKRILKNNAK